MSWEAPPLELVEDDSGNIVEVRGSKELLAMVVHQFPNTQLVECDVWTFKYEVDSDE